MTEEMKMILALIQFLNLDIKATGGDATLEAITTSLFGRDKKGEYTYTVSTRS